MKSISGIALYFGVRFLYFINKIDKERLYMTQLTFLSKIDCTAIQEELESLLEEVRILKYIQN